MKVPYIVSLTFVLFAAFSTSFAQIIPNNNFWEKPTIEDWLNPQHFMQNGAASGTSFEDLVVPCDCTVEQAGFSASVSSMLGAVDPVSFYAYNALGNSSANTGLEASETLRLFLYEAPDGSISFFFILDDGDGTGGNANVDFECMPLGTQVLFIDDPASSGSPDQVTGTAPTFTGNWGWGPANTDGVVFGNLGCGFTIDIYPNTLNGINTIEFVTGDLAMPTLIALPSLHLPSNSSFSKTFLVTSIRLSPVKVKFLAFLFCSSVRSVITSTRHLVFF